MLNQLLYKPDRNRLETKALEAASEEPEAEDDDDWIDGAVDATLDVDVEEEIADGEEALEFDATPCAPDEDEDADALLDALGQTEPTVAAGAVESLGDGESSSFEEDLLEVDDIEVEEIDAGDDPDELDDLMDAVLPSAPDTDEAERIEGVDELSAAVDVDGKVDLADLIGLEEDEPEAIEGAQAATPAPTKKKVAKRPTKKKLAKKPGANRPAAPKPEPADETEGDLDDLFDQIQLD